MWECNNCGTKNKSEYAFCQTCGEKQPLYQEQQKKSGKSVFPIAIITGLSCLCIVLAALLINNSYGKVNQSVSYRPNTSATYEDSPQTPQPMLQTPLPSTAQPQVPVYSSSPAIVSTPEPTASPVPTPTPYVNTTFTPYGSAYWNYKNCGFAYSSGEILQLISDTYYSRKDDKGNYKKGYASGRNKENEYGYDFGFYYGDNLLYYAEVRTGSPAEILVKLYYWDGAVIGCRDYRGNDSNLYTRGSENCDRIAREFSYVYSLGTK